MMATSSGHADPIGPKPGELVTVRGFQFSISARSQEFAPGTPVVVDVATKNVTDKSHYLASNSNPRIYKVEVTNEKGEKIPLTRYGQRVVNGLSTDFGIGLLEIFPGESDNYHLMVNQLYDMTEPGVYSVKVKRGIRTDTDVNFVDTFSNILRIKVQ